MRRIYILLSTLLFILFFGSFANAQNKNAYIKGKITDEKGVGLDLVNVGIINIKTPIGATTNQKGEFSFTVPANKELEIAISYIGYATKLYKIILKPNETKQINFSLVRSNTTLNEIEIREDNSRSEGITRIKTEWAKMLLDQPQELKD